MSVSFIFFVLTVPALMFSQELWLVCVGISTLLLLMEENG
jgi:hypothetical protein